MKKKFETAASVIDAKLNKLGKEELENIKKQKLSHSHSVSGDKPSKSHTDQARHRRNSSNTR
ncbi:MAG: hypothetical protein RCG15_03575 [Candidatus Rickettsia vulgarisii]